MKIIAITGKGGAGKTTFSNILSENKEIGVIHVDDFAGKAKRRYFKPFLQPESNNNTESTKKSPKVKNGIKKLLFRNKYTYNFFMFIRSKLVERELEEAIIQLEQDGKKIIVIDDRAILTHKKILPRLRKIYLLERKTTSRKQGLKERNQMTKEELKIEDIPYALGFYQSPTGNNVEIIKNNGTMEELGIAAQQVYEELREKTFYEKYHENIETDCKNRGISENILTKTLDADKNTKEHDEK